jgi:hypothetical protein
MDYTPPTTDDLQTLKAELGATGTQMAILFGLAGDQQWRKYTGGQFPREMGPHMLFFGAARLALTADELARVLKRAAEIGGKLDLETLLESPKSDIRGLKIEITDAITTTTARRERSMSIFAAAQAEAASEEIAKEAARNARIEAEKREKQERANAVMAVLDPIVIPLFEAEAKAISEAGCKGEFTKKVVDDNVVYYLGFHVRPPQGPKERYYEIMVSYSIFFGYTLNLMFGGHGIDWFKSRRDGKDIYDITPEFLADFMRTAFVSAKLNINRS